MTRKPARIRVLSLLVVAALTAFVVACADKPKGDSKVEPALLEPENAMEQDLTKDDVKLPTLLRKTIELEIYLTNTFWVVPERAGKRLAWEELQLKLGHEQGKDVQDLKRIDGIKAKIEEAKGTEADPGYPHHLAAFTTMSGWRDAAIARINERLGNSKTLESTSAELAQTLRAEKDLAERTIDRLSKLQAGFDTLANASAHPSEEELATIAINLRLPFIKSDGAPQLRDRIASEMKITLKNIWGVWSKLKLDKPVRALFDLSTSESGSNGAALESFFVFQSADDVTFNRSPHEPLPKDSIEAYRTKMRTFAFRHPGGMVAEQWSIYSDDEKKQRSLLSKLGEDGTAERQMVRRVVKDLNDAYGEIEVPYSVRKALTNSYNAKTSLMEPNPLALAAAIFGSILLFGGLAFSIFRAISARSDPALPPTA